MKSFGRAFGCELLKTFRSKITLVITVVVTIIPLICGLFMVILKNPEQAQKYGLIGAKARLAGSADWPSLLALLAQMTVTGAIIFAFLVAWIFGREFSDRTTRIWLATPTKRSTVVAAKFTVALVWCTILTIWQFVLGIVMGFLVNIPGFSMDALSNYTATTAVAALMTLILLSPVGFVASTGRGYLPALGYAIASLAFANIASTLGWGAFVPWSIPMMYCQVSGGSGVALGVGSYIIVALTSLAGLTGTFIWWKRADQTR